MPFIDFPHARNVGRLYVQRDQQIAIPRPKDEVGTGLDLVADAQGSVYVEQDDLDRLVLVVNAIGAADLSFLHAPSASAIRAISLRGSDSNPEPLRSLGAVRGLQRLRIWQAPEQAIEGEWLSSLRDLRVLQLSGPGIKDELFPFLAELTDLEHLDLSGNAIQGRGLAALRSLPNLAHLRLAHTPNLAEEGWMEIGSLGALRTLSLMGSWDYTESTDLDYDELLQHIARLQSLERLDLTDLPLDGRGFRYLRALSRLRRLIISHPHNKQPTASDLAHLAQLPALSVLEMESVSLTAEALQRLAASPQLAVLNCRQDLLSDATPLRGHEGLVHLLSMPTLRDLTLTGNFPDDEAFYLLSKIPQLEALDISNATDAGAQYLAGLTALRVLRLSMIEPGGSGLAELKRLSRLERLGLDVPLADEAILAGLFEGLLQLQHLALAIRGEQGLETLTHAHLRALHTLSLGAHSLQAASLAALARATGLRQLRVAANPITAPVVATIAQARALTALTLARTGLDDEGATYLSVLSSLRRLDLRANPITTRCLQALLPMGHLYYLNISDTLIDDGAIAILRRLPRLTYLVSVGSKVTAEGGRRLSAALPNCTIR